MTDLLDSLIDVVLGGVLLAVVFFIAVRLRARRFQRMRRLAEQLGLRYTDLQFGTAAGEAARPHVKALRQQPAGGAVLSLLKAMPASHNFRVDGRFDGVPVRIFFDMVTRNVRATALRADFEHPMGVGLRIVQPPAFGEVPRAMVRSGVAALDARALAEGRDPVAVQRLLADLPVQQALARLFDTSDLVFVDDAGVQSRLRGEPPDVEAVRPALARLAAAAKALQAARPDAPGVAGGAAGPARDRL
jgi:hypothetical protein